MQTLRCLGIAAFGLTLWQIAASAQTDNTRPGAVRSLRPNDSSTGVVGARGSLTAPEFTPLTASERLRFYLESSFGPGAFLRAAAAGGIAQWSGTPKEWGGGAKAYGERVGNSFAKHVIRQTLQYGAASALREDNRYFRSTEAGFWKRTEHAVTSTFEARNDGGRDHFAYSRFGSALGASFISRLWQPRSTNSAGDAAVNFGITIATDIGWNVFREFRPNRLRRF